MPIIKIVKKVVEHRKRTPSNVLIENVQGVILNSDGNFIISANENQYLIYPPCFRTKGVRVVYAQDELGRWFQYDRVCEDDRRQMPKNYLPFKPNFECIGNVILDNDTKYFNIKVSWNPHDITMRERMLKRYLNNDEQ